MREKAKHSHSLCDHWPQFNELAGQINSLTIVYIIIMGRQATANSRSNNNNSNNNNNSFPLAKTLLWSGASVRSWQTGMKIRPTRAPDFDPAIRPEEASGRDGERATLESSTRKAVHYLAYSFLYEPARPALGRLFLFLQSHAHLASCLVARAAKGELNATRGQEQIPQFDLIRCARLARGSLRWRTIMGRGQDWRSQMTMTIAPSAQTAKPASRFVLRRPH